MDTIITTIAIGAMAVAAIVFFGMLFSVPVWLLWNGCLVLASCSYCNASCICI